jgi:DNA-binding MarR family transcriptional regulator
MKSGREMVDMSMIRSGADASSAPLSQVNMRQAVHREIARLLAQFRRLCSVAVNKQLAVVGSTMHEFVVLLRLSEEDEVAQAELPYEAAIDPAAVSRLIRDLTRSGLVSSRVDPTDKRQRFVKISQKGRTLVRTLSPIVDSTLAPYMAGLNGEEEQEFLRLLRKAYETVAQVAEREGGDESSAQRQRLGNRAPSRASAGPSQRARPRKSQSAS